MLPTLGAEEELLFEETVDFGANRLAEQLSSYSTPVELQLDQSITIIYGIHAIVIADVQPISRICSLILLLVSLLLANIR